MKTKLIVPIVLGITLLAGTALAKDTATSYYKVRGYNKQTGYYVAQNVDDRYDVIGFKPEEVVGMLPNPRDFVKAVWNTKATTGGLMYIKRIHSCYCDCEPCLMGNCELCKKECDGHARDEDFLTEADRR